VVRDGRLRIGIDASCWGNKRGYGRYTRELLRAVLTLDQQNEYRLFLDAETARQCEDLPRAEQARRVVVETSQAAAWHASVSGHRSLRDLWAMGRAVRQYGPDLDLFYFPSVSTFFPVRGPAKIVITIYDAIPRRYPELIFPRWRNQLLWRLKMRWAVWQASLITTISETAKQNIVQDLRLTESRVKVVPGAVSRVFHSLSDRSQMRRVVGKYGIEDNERFILYVGGISPHKNLPTVLAAYAALIQRPGVQDVKLVVAGDFGIGAFSSNYPALQEKIAALGLSGKVIFTGFIADSELLQFYNAGELLVLPSFDEGFGLPALEAMACGTPVVASRAGAMPEVIGEAGRYFNPYAPEELTVRLQEVLADQPLREEMRRQGLRRAQAFSWERSAHAVLAAFEQLGRNPGAS
jgi:glycosyltransferase involved in cell wall biosynthesis